MRFRKRLSAAILAIVMMASSIQIPGEISYAAEMSDSGIESGQDASVLTAEELENTETVDPDGGAVTDDGSQPDDEGAVSDGANPADGDSQPGDDNPTGDDSQTGDDNLTAGDSQTGDGSQTGDDNPADDDSQTDDENDPAEKADDRQVSGNDLERSVLSAEKEEVVTEEDEMVEAEIEGAYQFGGAPSARGRISAFSTSTYDASVIEYLYQKLLEREEVIDVSAYGVTKDAVGGLISGVLNEKPDLYFVNSRFNYGLESGTDNVTDIFFTYDTSYDDAAFNENTAAALVCVSDGMSDAEKAAVLHDYLAVNVEYDYDNLQADTVPMVSHNAYGALVNGVSVCQGYALAYKYLLGKVGIESYMVTSASMNHAWNMVKLDGTYYHVDVTWDDPVRDMVGKTLHSNMFCSDIGIEEQEHEGWQVTSGSDVVDYRATDRTYESAFWVKSTAPIVINGSDCYYVSYDSTNGGRIMKSGFANITDEGTEVVNIGKWTYNYNGHPVPWPAAYSGLYMIDDRLFYNDMTSIYSVKLDGTGKRTEFTADTTGNYSIYGSAYRGGTVFYALHTSPNLTGKEELLIAELSGAADEPDPPEETKEGYNVDNLDDNWLAEYEFKNVLDSNGKTTPKADGKPVVLIFYNSSNVTANGVSTFKSIAEHVGYFKTDADSVDFYGIDTNFNNTEDDIINFAKNNGISGTGVLNWLYVLKASPCMNDYVNRIKGYSSVTGYTYPLMIYIDKNNKIQYATEGNLAAEDILVNLRQYCGYTQYRITYEMDGGTNNRNNPNMYTGDEEVMLQNPPYRNGYLFNGWYKDAEFTQKATKIPAGSRNDVTFYAKWTKGPYNLANLTQEYTTLDDTKVSSTADGKPKLLLFFESSSDTGIFEDITDELADENSDLHGVDIYAIETGKATKSALSDYSREYAENIIFCYDTSGVNEQYMYDYAKASGFDMEYPESIFKCYIDKDNRLQYVNYYMCILEVIKKHLQEYCNYPSAAYKIQYELNGGINDSSNPSSYNSGMETITLKAPTKEGFGFGGWYADAEFTKRVKEIPKGSTGDITLYAKWNDGLNADNPEYTFNTIDDGKVSSTADGKPKVLLFFSGSEMASQQVNKDLSEHITAFGGVDIYSIAIISNKNTVTTFKSQYGCDDITYCYDTNLQNLTRMVNYVKIIDPGADSSTAPVIVYIDAENRVQQVIVGSRSWTGIFDDLREYCAYDNGYWINYELYGGKNNSENPYVYMDDTDTIILKDPVNGANKFEGWYKDAEFTETEKVTEIPKGSTGDITLYAKWIKASAGLGLNNPDKTFKAVDDTTFSSTAENGRPRILVFFSYKCPRSVTTLDNIKAAKEDLEGVDIYKIESQYQDKDMVTQIQEYYEFEKGTVSYDTGNNNINAMHEYLKAGNVTGTVEFPVLCYIDANNYLQWVTMGKSATANTIKTYLKDYCNYPPEPEGLYHITYELDGGTNHKDNPDTYTSETETIILKDPSKVKFIFEGWYKDADFSESSKVTEIVKGSEGDITLYAKWRENEEGGLGIDNLDQTYKGLGGEALSSEADGKPKLLVFFMTGSNASQNTFNNIKEIIDSLDGVDIYAIEMSQAYASAVTAFKNTYGCDGITFAYDDWSSPSNYDKAAAYEEAAGLSGMYSPLICYIDKDNKLQWVTENEQTGDAILENLQKYCSYPPQEETYTITYELNGGTNSSSNPKTYTSETDTIVLEDPVREGYVFEGWYKDAEFTDTEKVTDIPKGSTGDITLYAKWNEKGTDWDNPAVEFTTVDDKTVSSTANGKPKLILFYDYDESYSTETINEIARKLVSDPEGLDTVDIYAVEVNQGTKEDVLDVKQFFGYSLDNIIYSYDTGDANKNSMLEYAEAAGIGSVNQLPMLCYIDAANRLRYISLGYVKADEIVSNIQKYCDSSVPVPGTYKITYVLDGGTNSSENPETYTSETDTITLVDAVKEGYIFEGWYKDAEFTDTEKVTEIPKGSTGDITLYAKWKQAEMIVSIKRPDRTTYKVGQELDLTGGKIILTDRLDESIQEEKDMEPGMIKGFDSSEPGICTVTVTYDDYAARFEALIVEEPKVTVVSGEKLGSAKFPKNDYGAYAWADDVDPEKVLNDIDVYTYGAVFIPNDTEKFQTLTDLQIQVQIARRLTDACAKIEFLDGPYRYIGEQIRPKVKVTYTDSMGNTVTLIEGQDYELSCSRENLFEVGGVTVSGINEYTDEIERDFEITRAVRTIRVLDKVILVGSEIPTDFEYEIVGGLYGDDQLFMEPEFSCGITSTAEEGEYEIKANGADADFYMFHYEPGTLYVVSELDTRKVTFDVQGHGTAPKALVGIRTGATIDSPEEPTAVGYRFDGWYKDTACMKAWDFENDTVQSDLTLYAKWLVLDNDGEFAVQEIADVYYTGKAQKPTISVYDEGRLLKEGKDYTIKYYNNINANAGGVLKGEEFNPNIPYVAVTGKGNYKETVKINFNILRASIGDGSNPAAGVTLKVNDQLVKSGKAIKPFGSIKYGRKMKLGTDFELKLEAMVARDASGSLVFGSFDNAQVPAGYAGEFILTVTGVGNYTGSISRSVYVADKAHLMKNVKITLGKDLKNIVYTGSGIELKAAAKQKPGNDEFVVTYGRTVLKPDEDYYVTYRNNVSVGKAELIVIGKGEYTGRKTANFNIKGKAFTNGTVTVEGLGDQAYTGRAVVQNQNAVLTWKADGTKLVYGQDYTVSYSKNINKGTATITFIGKAEAGYSGRISKKFKISAADIADVSRVTRAESMNAITQPYSKAGVKPADEIILTNERGTRLRLGKDYTLAYKNNKAVASADAEKAPTVTVKGKGNYSGTFDVKFTIERADLNGENITIECSQVAYNSNKPDSYVYKPAVKVKDGKTALKAGTDYEITYEKNTQEDCRDYIQNLIDNQLAVPPMEGRAMAVITGKEDSAYSLQEPIRIPLEIYLEKLKKSDLDVQIGSAVYTGGQVRPEVTVRYKNMLLEEGVDYTLIYGANTASGKNKGSVTVKGLAPDYGGSVTWKFDIVRKDLKYWFLPEIDEK